MGWRLSLKQNIIRDAKRATTGSCTAVGSRQETFIESPLVHAGFLIFESGLIESA
jgi:hypothetical protein